MQLGHLNHHLENRFSRRRALGLAAKATAAGVLSAAGLGAAAPPTFAGPEKRSSGGAGDPEGWEDSDEMFDVDAVANGAWVPGPYGPEDQRGSFNEVTPAKTAAALAALHPRRPVKTYNLGDLMFNGYPAYPIAVPPRVYHQQLTVLGYLPPPTFFAEGGFLQDPVPLGPNLISAHEERFPAGGTYQIATQLDNLNHIGLGDLFYNGFRGPDIAAGHGTTALGNEHMGSIVTRCVVLDVLGLKVANGRTDDYFTTSTGAPVLRDGYRITVADLKAAMKRQRTAPIEPGDVVIIRTGWNQLVREDPLRYLGEEPGIWHREVRWLGAHRPALVASDTWGLECLDSELIGDLLFPVHQELFMRFGVRIGEGFVTDDLVADGVYDAVFVITPQHAEGATAGNTPPIALAQPER